MPISIIAKKELFCNKDFFNANNSSILLSIVCNVNKNRKKMKSFKSGTYISQGTYKSFQPNLINKQWLLDDMEIIDLLSKADRHLGRLDMYSEYIPDVDLFISIART